MKLADLAVTNPAMAQLAPAPNEMQMLGRVLIPLTKAAAIPGSGRVLSLVHRMQTSGEHAFATWAGLALEARKLGTLLGPVPVGNPGRKTGLLGKVKFWAR